MNCALPLGGTSYIFSKIQTIIIMVNMVLFLNRGGIPQERILTPISFSFFQVIVRLPTFPFRYVLNKLSSHSYSQLLTLY